MANDERLIERVRDVLARHGRIGERKMFGVNCFMLDGNLCCGVRADDLILRLGDADVEAALADPHGRPFDMAPRPMKRWVMMDAAALETDEDLWRWLEPAVDFASSLPPK